MGICVSIPASITCHEGTKPVLHCVGGSCTHTTTGGIAADDNSINLEPEQNTGQRCSEERTAKLLLYHSFSRSRSAYYRLRRKIAKIVASIEALESSRYFLLIPVTARVQILVDDPGKDYRFAPHTKNLDETFDVGKRIMKAVWRVQWTSRRQIGIANIYNDKNLLVPERQPFR